MNECWHGRADPAQQLAAGATVTVTLTEGHVLGGGAFSRVSVVTEVRHAAPSAALSSSSKQIASPCSSRCRARELRTAV